MARHGSDIVVVDASETRSMEIGAFVLLPRIIQAHVSAVKSLIDVSEQRVSSRPAAQKATRIATEIMLANFASMSPSKSMRVLAAMFETRSRAEEAIERLVAARCPRDAITFLPEEELSSVASTGAYDWQADRWGLWRGLATFEVISNADRYRLAEGMNRGGSVLLVAVRETDAERYGATLTEAGAIDLDELEQNWREAGWQGFDGQSDPSIASGRPLTKAARIKMF